MNPFHVGHLYRLPHFLRFISLNPEAAVAPTSGLDHWQGLDSRSLARTATTGGWLAEADGLLKVTAEGTALVAMEEPERQLRMQVSKLVTVLRPPWVHLFTQGRAAVALYAPPEAKQCLEESGLLAGQDEETIGWWDEIAQGERAATDASLIEIGRRGERATMDYEQQRTGKRPTWTALERTAAGYDVLSCVDARDPTPLAIEVKATQRAWEAGRFHLSRNEWEHLRLAPHGQLHLWSFASQPCLFAVVEVNVVGGHMPQDSGAGMWEECAVSFEAVAPQPVEVP